MSEIYKFDGRSVILKPEDTEHIQELRRECNARLSQVMGELAILNMLENQSGPKPQDFGF